jgi:hypothetical protein
MNPSITVPFMVMSSPAGIVAAENPFGLFHMILQWKKQGHFSFA